MKLPALASTVAVSGVIHATLLLTWATFSTPPRQQPALTFSTTIEAVLMDAALDAGQTPEPSSPAADAAATAALTASNKELHADIATLLATRKTLQGTVAALEQDKSALLADKASLGEQLATVTGERQQLSADKATLLETRKTLEGEAEQLATTQAQQQQQLLELESVRVGLSDDLNRLQGVLNLEQRASATLAQKVVTLELARHKTVTHLNGLLAQLDSENQDLDASLRQLRNEKYRAEVTLQDRARQIESLSQQVETLLSEKRSQRQPALPAAVADNPTSPPAPAIATANDPPPQKLSAPAEKTSTNLSTATASSLAAPETGNAVHDVEPRPVAGNPKPVYPRLAIRQQLEGTVILTIDVLPSGKVANISVETGSGFSLLDRAAIKAVSQWRFTPAHRAGAPTMVVTQSIQFQLGDGRS
jgi:TonB family protein